MRILSLLVLALVASTSFGVISTVQKDMLNNRFGLSVPHIVQLGTLIQNLEPTSTAGLTRGDLQMADTTIPTASVLTLNATPVSLLAAPGAGYVNIVERIYATVTFNSIAYVCNAAGLSVRYTDGSGATAATLTQGFCQSAASAIQSVGAIATALTPVANAALVLHAGSADPTTGNSAIKVRVFYRRVPSPLP